MPCQHWKLKGGHEITKVSLPLFKGLLGEKLDLHVLKINEWLVNNRAPKHHKPHDFRYSLDAVVQEWFHDIILSENWNVTETLLHGYFSIQGWQLNTCMKDGENLNLVLTLMMLKASSVIESKWPISSTKKT